MVKLKYKIIAIIPARGGSKGIPRKNLKDLGGKPLIAHIIGTALKVNEIDRVIVSTEDKEIAEVSKKYGAEVPFLRPQDLAEDDVPTLPVIQNVLESLKKHENYIPDYVLLLYPTSPLLSKDRVQEAVDLCLKTGADSVISGTFDNKHYWIKDGGGWARLYPTEIKNRQHTAPLFKENGAIYLSKTSVLKKQIAADRAAIVIMGEKENIDIDTQDDLEQVRNILKNKLI